MIANTYAVAKRVRLSSNECIAIGRHTPTIPGDIATERIRKPLKSGSFFSTWKSNRNLIEKSIRELPTRAKIRHALTRMVCSLNLSFASVKSRYSTKKKVISSARAVTIDVAMY